MGNSTASMFAMGSHLAAILMANTLYSAYAFHQARKKEPLTQEEMEEIQRVVAEEIAEISKMYTGDIQQVK